MKRALLTPAFWAWLALASLPPDLLAWAMGWDAMRPAYLAVALAWWPVEVLAGLAALRLLLREEGNPLADGPAAEPGLARAWASAQSAELRVALWGTVWALAGLLPAALVLSLGALASVPGRALFILLAALGVGPALLYGLRRSVAVFYVLQGQRAGQALDSSRRRLTGKIWPFIRAFLPWLAEAWALDGLGWCLPEPWGLPLEPLSAALELLGLWRAARAL